MPKINFQADKYLGIDLFNTEYLGMFLRAKRSVQNGRTYEYLQIVETFRDSGKVKQRIIATLGKLDELRQTGKLDAFLASAAKLSDKAAVIGEHQTGRLETVATRKVGPVLVFKRLWQELKIGDSLREMLAGRKFKFDVEEAIFLTVLQRLFDPGSDRAADKWRGDHAFPETAMSLDLHQLYRAMRWLGEPLPDEEQSGRTPFAPQCRKDLLEEKLFLAKAPPVHGACGAFLRYNEHLF